MGISEHHKDLLMILLKSQEIGPKLEIKGELPKLVDIDDDGTVTVYGSNWKWLAYVTGKVKDVDLTTILLHISKVISGMGGIDDRRLLRAMFLDVCEKCIEEKKFNEAIDSVFDALRFLAAGELRSRHMYFGAGPSVNIHVNNKSKVPTPGYLLASINPGESLQIPIHYINSYDE